jgi:adenylate kinase family enzyme
LKAQIMPLKVFVLGLPGSGKSTVSRYIVEHVNLRRKGWTASRINDYDILLEMFRSAEHKHRFRSTKKYEGFNVHDLHVYAEALEKLEAKVHNSYSSPNDLIIIEFARNDYQKALKQFKSNFLQGAYIIFLDVDINTCIQRVSNRIVHPASNDDHFVSRTIFQHYRHTNPKQYIATNLLTDFGLDEKMVLIINNRGAETDFEVPIIRFIDSIFELAGGNIIAARS